MRGKVWKSVVGGTICAVMALGTVYAGEGEGKGPRNKERRQKPAHAGRERGQRNESRRRGPVIEEVREEMDRFRAEQKSLREEAETLREKVQEAVKDARKGEGKPDREALKEVVKQFEDEARTLATKMTNARIQHHKNIVTILDNNEEKIVDKMTRMLLSPRPGRGRGPRGGKGGERGGKDGDHPGRKRARGDGQGNAGGDLTD